ncbi:hypothetical protein [Aeromicrobium sp. Leaf245]|uniref:hypothetical protein n=1 Tax=Aeromicrobium sp. Leaf245 TaxID=1736306 RepID=UPI0012E22306|nr:hypothetical protein [Aeromicrobium sp. Leaf245]
MSERGGPPHRGEPNSSDAVADDPATELRRKPRRRFWMLAALLAIVVACSYTVIELNDGPPGRSSSPAPSPTAPLDSDRDGLSNEVEAATWITRSGTFRTDPEVADTDGDGLSDGEEAGELVAGQRAEKAVYLGFSDPTSIDSDGDGLSDADEADLSIDPYERDTDGDGIPDGREVEAIGTAPDVVDTDGDGFDDGFEDANREERGLDPLVVDVKVGKLSYAFDFAKGSITGDLWREDSLAWLAGNLTSGGASSIPVIGSAVGAVFDLRDVVGSAIRADWVGSGFSAVGAVPGGDLVALPGKAAKFVSRNPELTPAAAAIVATAAKVPADIKLKAARAMWGQSWEDLKSAGASNKALLQLTRGKTNLRRVAEARERPGHIDGGLGKFFSTGSAGERFLASLYGVNAKGADTQVSASTRGCEVVCNSVRRRFDVVADGIAHESKVGKVSLTASVEKQLRSDAYLIETGAIEGAHWHFFASSASNTLGSSKRLLDRLDELNIPYTIHLLA